MKLNELELKKLLPQFMQDDKSAQALAYAVETVFKDTINSIIYVKIYSRINELSDELLDELAWQFNVPEYNATYDLETKRALIKSCFMTHYTRGTVGIVEKIVNDIFGDARVVEWFDYDGQPFHFRVHTSNPSASDEMLEEFERIVKVTQNCRSYLEAVVVELLQSMNIYVGITCTIGTVEHFKCQ